MCDDVVCGNRKRKNIVLVVQGKRPRSQMTGSEGIDHGDSRVTDGTYGRDACARAGMVVAGADARCWLSTEPATHLEVCVYSASHLLGVGSSDAAGGALSYADEVVSSKFHPYVLVKWAMDTVPAGGGGAGGAGAGGQPPLVSAPSFRQAQDVGIATPAAAGLVSPVWKGVGLLLSINNGDSGLYVAPPAARLVCVCVRVCGCV